MSKVDTRELIHLRLKYISRLNLFLLHEPRLGSHHTTTSGSCLVPMVVRRVPAKSSSILYAAV